MKKLLLTILILLFAGSSYGAGTCIVNGPIRGDMLGGKTSNYVIRVDCTADSSDGSYPETPIGRGNDTYPIGNIGGYLMSVTFDPGTGTVPLTGMDMTLEFGATNIDLLGGAGANLVTSADALITPLVGEVSAPVGFTGDLLLSLTNNNVNSATLTIYINIDKGN